ncbi:activator-dependent family glycosyltransferase [Actinomadura sp. KC345]|uniref:activator-dependent family glycosyltransferase n=1 Tax=Actinomadura sp. KC345 TaxID=2530371 RepID=UPI001049B32A|nr:activator-dependent family glycosyltransferase [Actinomadura sp. KC345]TDC44519.1 activator-dependent family glycosyltransferase [Actinomadura sp. KC345]
MRVLFTTLPVKAHLYLQVPLAWALRAAGHEVRFAVQPDIVDDVTGAGLTAVSIGEAVQQGEPASAEPVPDEDHPWNSEWERVLDLAESRPERLGYDYLQGVLTAWTFNFMTISPERLVDELVGLARSWRPDLVIWDPVVFAGPVAARACGAAHARLLFGLDLVGHMRERYLGFVHDRPRELREDPLDEWLGWVLARYGHTFAEDAVAGMWTIDPVPPSTRPAAGRHRVPVRYVPYNGQAAIPGWLREPPKRRRVCLTLGLSFREVLGRDRVSVARLLEAVADVDAEVVATLNADQLAGVPAVPDNVRAVDFVALNALLPTCSAIIHQGGIGQSQTALVHGVPQVVLPNGRWDTVPRARRLHGTGAGIHVGDDDGAPSADTVRRALLRVLDEPSFARNAGRLRTEMLGMPAPADIVPVLETLTAEHSGHGSG